METPSHISVIRRSQADRLFAGGGDISGSHRLRCTLQLLAVNTVLVSGGWVGG